MTDPNLDYIVDVAISATTQTPSRPGFGVALLMASDVPAGWGPNLVRSFGSPDEVAAAGFVNANEARAAASVYFAQNPRPAKLKIAKRLSKPTQKFTLTVNSAVNGQVYSALLGGLPLEFTAGIADTPTTIAAGLLADVTAPSGASGAVAAGVLTLTGLLAGASFGLQVLGGDMSIAETTADPGIADDLDAVQGEDGDWYGLLLDIAGKPTVLAAGAWAEANGKLFAYDTSDSDCANPVAATDILSLMTAQGLAHSTGWYSHKKTNNRVAAGVLGRLFPYDPGTENWAFKNLTSVTVIPVDSSTFQTIDNKRGNLYAKVQGASMTWQGKTHGLAWIDATRAVDWLNATVKIDFFELFLNNLRVPATDFGVDMCVNQVEGTLSRAENKGVLDGARGHTVTAPKVATLSAAQLETRVLPDVVFTAHFQGAFNRVQIRGTVTP